MIAKTLSILTLIVNIITFVMLGAYYLSTNDQLETMKFKQQRITKQVDTLQSRYDDGDSNIAPTKTTVKHNSTDISIKTTQSELENSQSLIASNHNAWVDINLGKGVTAFAYNTGAGSDISEKTYYDGIYNINGKAYKAVSIQSIRHNNQREWDLLRQSKENQAYLISQDKNNANNDNILLLEQA